MKDKVGLIIALVILILIAMYAIFTPFLNFQYKVCILLLDFYVLKEVIYMLKENK